MFYREHPRITLDCGTISLTKQSHKQECDINHILKQYQKTGIITHVQSARPSYTDLPSELDFQSALNTLMEADKAFHALPAPVRAHFDNDPARFLAAFDDPKQHDKLRDFGLLKPTLPTPSSLNANLEVGGGAGGGHLGPIPDKPTDVGVGGRSRPPTNRWHSAPTCY